MVIWYLFGLTSNSICRALGSTGPFTKNPSVFQVLFYSYFIVDRPRSYDQNLLLYHLETRPNGRYVHLTGHSEQAPFFELKHDRARLEIKVNFNLLQAWTVSQGEPSLKTI